MVFNNYRKYIMKMTNQQVVDLYLGLKTVEDLSGVKFAYAVAKNMVILDREIKPIRVAAEPNGEFKIYEDARIKLAEGHAVIEDGKPKTYVEDGFQRYTIKDQAKFEEDFKQLRTKHRKAISDRKNQEEEVDLLTKENIEVDIYMIPPSYIPENISTKQMVAILPIVKEK